MLRHVSHRPLLTRSPLFQPKRPRSRNPRRGGRHPDPKRFFGLVMGRINKFRNRKQKKAHFRPLRGDASGKP